MCKQELYNWYLNKIKDEYSKFLKYENSYRFSTCQRDPNGYCTNSKANNSLDWINTRLDTSKHKFSEIKGQINRKHKLKHRGKKNKKNRKKCKRYLVHNQMVYTLGN